MSKINKAIKFAVEKKGYKVIAGNVFFKNKEVKKRINNSGYYSFCIRDKNKERRAIPVHKVVAFQKYGNETFRKEIQVRHLDGNPLNNLDDNILIGSASDNNMDKLINVRKRAANIATSFVKIHDHEKVIRLRKQGLSYSKIMKELNITSKSIINFILKKSNESKK
ncbi:MAG TPA: hypothetical protein VE933_04070 [Chitinophagaceae bacterium]|nr:hypothetical protein [Chitinophagaceae bacterium]